MTVKVFVSLSSLNRDTSRRAPCPINLDRLGELGYLTFGEIVQFKYFEQVFNAAGVIFENDVFIEFQSIL